MSRKHIWRIKNQYFKQHRHGDKDIEVRVGYDQIKKVAEGDTIVFEGHEEDEFLVERITRYDSFEKMLQEEGVDHVLPNTQFGKALSKLHAIYPKTKEALGVYAFKLKLRSRREAFTASELLKQKRYKEFSQIIAESYAITDWIIEDYPKHCESFYTKYVPGIFTGQREIIGYRCNGKVIAVAFMKKALEPTSLGPNGRSEIERKLSTLYVSPEYRNQGIAGELLKKCFEWLGTEKPLATIAGYKLDQFSGIIQKYGWEETQILEKGYYGQKAEEHVFNGKII